MTLESKGNIRYSYCSLLCLLVSTANSSFIFLIKGFIFSKLFACGVWIRTEISDHRYMYKFVVNITVEERLTLIDQ